MLTKLLMRKPLHNNQFSLDKLLENILLNILEKKLMFDTTGKYFIYIFL